MNLSAKLGASLMLVWVAAILVGAIGWAMNIYTLLTTYEVMDTPEFVLRLVGVPLALLGAFMGWF